MDHTRKYLGLDFVWYFTTAYVPTEHRTRVTFFLIKHVCIFSKIYVSTYKNKERSIQLKFFLLHFSLATSRRIIYINLFFSLYLNLENTEQLTKASQSISSSSELWMYHALLTWYEREYLRYKIHFKIFPRAPCPLRLFVSKFKTQRSPLGPAGRCMSWQIPQWFQIHKIYLATACVGVRNVLLLRNSASTVFCC
jgi:hypothetical protein